MSPARKIALTIARNSLRLLIVWVITITAFMATLGNENTIKQVLESTNAHERFIPSLLQAAVKQQPDSILADKTVQQYIIKTFPPELLAYESHKVIDAFYDWLRGESTEPTFTVSFERQRQQIAEQLSIYAIERLSSLPTCSGRVDTLDPFTATCQPIGVNYKSEQEALRLILLRSDSFLPNSTYTQADLPKNSKGEPLAVAFSNAPALFQLQFPLLIASVVLLILLMAGIVALRPVRRNGLRDLSRSLVTISAFLAASAAVFGIAVPYFTRSYQSQFLGNGTEKLMSDVIREISIQFQIVFVMGAVLFVLMGIGIYLLLKISKEKSRYERLERVAGIVNAHAHPKIAPATVSEKEIPVVSSEIKSIKHAPRKSKKNAIKKEIA